MTRKAPPGERIHPRGPADILGARAAAAACSYTGQSRSASRPWRRRVNLVPRTLTTLTAPNKLLPSGLKLHQKNGGMEARRCHNSATVGAPPRLPTEPFVRVFQPGLRMRWSSSMATTELGGTASAKKTKPNGDAEVSERKAYSQLAATVGPSRGFEITGVLVQRNHGCHVVDGENVGYSFFLLSFHKCTRRCGH